MRVGETSDGTSISSHVRGGRSTYRPHLDGLRTVAVYLVVAFHAGLAGFGGGFIGVDVFFVLSGYLVTSLLWRELVANARVDRRRFYARRARRILPAALATLIVTATIWAVVATPAELFDIAGGFRAACLYAANWYFIHQSTDYFGANINSNPIVHFWSLAVEEQFYLVWPLLLGGLFAATRRSGRARWWILRGAVFLLASASAIAAWHIGRTHLDRAYFGTDTRAYQLLAGALLALTPQVFRLTRRFAARTMLAPVALAGLVVTGSSIFHMTPISRGFYATLFTGVLIVALEDPASEPTRSLLGSQPFAYLGRLSYGTYLWHWPVIVLLERNRNLPGTVVFVVSTVIATALAAFSFHVMEHPIRVSRQLDRAATAVVALGLAASVVVGIVFVPAVLKRNNTQEAAAAPNTLLDWRAAKKDFPNPPDCLGKALSVCVVTHGTKGRMLLMGDSNAHMWIPAMEQIAQAESLTLAIAVYDACPWQQGLYYTYGPFGGYQAQGNKTCMRHRDDWYNRLLPQFDPSIVVLAGTSLDNPKFRLPLIFPDGKRHAFGEPGYDLALDQMSASTIGKIRAPNRKIVVFEPAPSVYPFNPLQCLSQGGSPGRCARAVDAAATPLERYYRSLDAKSTSFFSIDLDRVVCPRLPVCDAVVHDIIVRFDANGHLTATFARSAAPEIETLLDDRHALPVRS
jgi:peptidoglycan/LPS O-acetylase OafA/YrhL